MNVLLDMSEISNEIRANILRMHKKCTDYAKNIYKNDKRLFLGK